MAVVERSVTIANKLGMHLRPAAEFVKIAATFSADITVGKDGHWVNAKSIMGVVTLAAEHGSRVTIRADGDDAEEAVAALLDCLGTKRVEQDG